MPVAIDPITISNLTSASKCFNCLSQSQKKIATIFFMAQTLKYLDGTDLTNVNTLSDAVKCFKCESDSALDSFEAATMAIAAESAGMPEMTLAQFQAAIKCWLCLDPKTVKAAYVLLAGELSIT